VPQHVGFDLERSARWRASNLERSRRSIRTGSCGERAASGLAGAFACGRARSRNRAAHFKSMADRHGFALPQRFRFAAIPGVALRLTAKGQDADFLLLVRSEPMGLRRVRAQGFGPPTKRRLRKGS